MFYCDPPGHTGPEHLFNWGRDDIVETDYVFLHDQEPVDPDLYADLFADVIRRNMDIEPAAQGHIIVSEQGSWVDRTVRAYGWQPHYYFYHGWAALDWFRGYDRTFLIAPYQQRQPTRAFFCPNRIIGGQRDHRVLLLYHVFQRQLQHNWISAPRTCPVEGTHIEHIAQRYVSAYPDIATILARADLPRTFPGETEQRMTSCWLTNFDQCADSVVYVATETVYWGQRLHLTEKTFKPIALGMPFVVAAPAGSLEYLRSYGFRTFGDVIDESYDQETNDLQRLEMIADVLADINSQTVPERQRIFAACAGAVAHNWQHFYGGGFEQTLWRELEGMLRGLCV
jgi:hypothetical protein